MKIFWILALVFLFSCEKELDRSLDEDKLKPFRQESKAIVLPSHEFKLWEEDDEEGAFSIFKLDNGTLGRLTFLRRAGSNYFVPGYDGNDVQISIFEEECEDRDQFLINEVVYHSRLDMTSQSVDFRFDRSKFAALAIEDGQKMRLFFAGEKNRVSGFCPIVKVELTKVLETDKLGDLRFSIRTILKTMERR